MGPGGDHKPRVASRSTYKPRFGDTFADGDFQQYENFKRKFQTMAVLYRWDNDVQCLELWNSLRGKAASRLSMLHWEDIEDTGILWRTLDRAFLPANYQRAMNDEFLNCRKKNNESMKVFCMNLQQLYIQGHIEASQKQIDESVREQMLAHLSEDDLEICVPFITENDPATLADKFDTACSQLKRSRRTSRRDADRALESLSKRTLTYGSTREVDTQISGETGISGGALMNDGSGVDRASLNPNAPIFSIQPTPAQYGQQPTPGTAVVTANVAQSHQVPPTQPLRQIINTSNQNAKNNQPQNGNFARTGPGNGNYGNKTNYRSRGNNGRMRNQQKDYSNVECWNCGEFGHFRRQCPETSRNGTKGYNNRNTGQDQVVPAEVIDSIAHQMQSETAKLEARQDENNRRLEQRLQEIVTNSLKATGLAPNTGTGN